MGGQILSAVLLGSQERQGLLTNVHSCLSQAVEHWHIVGLGANGCDDGSFC